MELPICKLVSLFAFFLFSLISPPSLALFGFWENEEMIGNYSFDSVFYMGLVSKKKWNLPQQSRVVGIGIDEEVFCLLFPPDQE